MKVLILLAKGIEMIEFCAFVDVLGWARVSFGMNIEVETCGYTEKVVSTFNVPILVDKIIHEINVDDYDAVAIPGGFEDFGGIVLYRYIYLHNIH